MRKYALVILGNKDEIIDRYDFDIVTNASGNGFQLDMSTISSNLEDIITQVIQKKLQIRFTVEQIENSYSKATVLSQWIQKYTPTKYTMALEYKVDSDVRYIDGRVTTLEKNEKENNSVLRQNLVFTTITPWYRKRNNTITIKTSSIGKSYPYKYPYSYGRNEILNNEIDNPYILEVPVIITIAGAIENPTIKLVDESGITYNQVIFDEDITNTQELIINSAQRKILLNTYTDSSKTILVSSEDYSNNTQPNGDTYLRAKSGTSTLSYTATSTGDGFEISGSWRQYIL